MKEGYNRKLQDERDALLREKRDIDAKLSVLKAKYDEQLSVLLRRGLKRHEQMTEATKLKARLGEDKQPLVRQKDAIEERLLDLKRKIVAVGSNKNEVVEVLVRIESLLERILDQMEVVPQENLR